ncbi:MULTISPECIES: hypothetical protein [unclassified Microcoleus]|uniref:hypothetical protein n=1 Tax=unclassified Microcoleus TaxID=2642155 RepID=UPI002FD3FCD5
MIDQALSPAVARNLCEELLIDAVAVCDRGLLGADDRILVTANVGDFERFARACEVHAGIIFLSKGNLLRSEQIAIARKCRNRLATAKYYYTGDRRCDSIIFAIQLYMMPLSSRSPIYFNLWNCRGDRVNCDRIWPLFAHRFLEFASWKTDACCCCVRNILLKQALPTLGQNAGRAIDYI